MKEFLKTLKNRYLLLTDLFLLLLAYVVSLPLVYPWVVYDALALETVFYAVMAGAIYVFFLLSFGLYSVYWVHASSKEFCKLIASAFLGFVCTVLVRTVPLDTKDMYLHYAICANGVSAFGICALRVFIKLLYNKIGIQGKTAGKRVLIIGAGSLAVMVLRDIKNEPELRYVPVGLIDDDKDKKNKTVYGAKVLGSRKDIERICVEKKVEEIIFAISSVSVEDKSEILEICARSGCRLKIMPAMEALFSGKFSIDSVRNIRIDDLLEREPIQLENNLIAENINGKTVLVTGGGGSIGSELCRQIAKYNPQQLLILDVYENAVYDLQNELRDMYPDMNMSVLIASVRDKKRLDDIFETYKPHIVFHAAAHKHVPLMEYSPAEAVKNNVFGTWNVAQCADSFGTEKFVMISTDKAVNPTNVMGATKRVCEMIVQALAKTSKTEFVAVRFGNVLGSNGSVIPLFQKQIEKGGPVTVTHPEIIRYFMTIPEAAHLVLQATSFAKGGEIFVLDMGEPVKIYDLAKKMILLAGFEPEKEIPITFTGLRPGEKLYEELLMSEEGLENTQHSKIFVGRPMEITKEELAEKLERLHIAAESQNSDEVKHALTDTVPTYRITDNQ